MVDASVWWYMDKKSGEEWAKRWIMLESGSKALTYYSIRDSREGDYGSYCLKQSTLLATHGLHITVQLNGDSRLDMVASDEVEATRFKHSLAHICAHVESVDDFYKAGYLLKEGTIMKNWKRRWISVKEGHLYYLVSPTSGKIKGSYNLARCTLDRTTGIDIILDAKTRKFKMRAATNVEAEEWKVFLQKYIESAHH